MNNFPITIFDRFFRDPDKLVSLANKLEYHDDESNYPGVRTVSLAQVDQTFNQLIIEKIISTFIGGNFYGSGDVHFQKSLAEFGTGIAHQDFGDLTCIVYLTKGGTGGTSFYNLKQDVLYRQNMNDEYKHHCIKNKLYDEYLDLSTKSKETLDLTATVSGNYNRAVMFEGSNIHAADNFAVNESGQERLFMIAFINDVVGKVTDTPICRSKDFLL